MSSSSPSRCEKGVTFLDWILKVRGNDDDDDVEERVIIQTLKHTSLRFASRFFSLLRPRETVHVSFRCRSASFFALCLSREVLKSFLVALSRARVMVNATDFDDF